MESCHELSALDNICLSIRKTCYLAPLRESPLHTVIVTPGDALEGMIKSGGHSIKKKEGRKPLPYQQEIMQPLRGSINRIYRGVASTVLEYTSGSIQFHPLEDMSVAT